MITRKAAGRFERGEYDATARRRRCDAADQRRVGIPSQPHGKGCKLPPFPAVSAPCNRSADDVRDPYGSFLEPPEQRQDEDDDQDQSQNSARPVAPAGAVGPSRQGAEQEQDQDDDQEGREHGGLQGKSTPRYYHRFPAALALLLHSGAAMEAPVSSISGADERGFVSNKLRAERRRVAPNKEF